ncbi:MAG: hypothetical protein UY35_C0001G0057 [Candidatus Saccharibacteria bacterium GW2011_GWC2_48_9]|nr:MAG: hypothetical protein UY35_C0001G0057 [Candidatus Saccharibacteria bacterium GW2011_GWC2_48_9]
MADKKKSSTTKVTTRVVAKTDEKKKSVKKDAPKLAAAKPQKQKKQRDNYFIGAWRELRQVRWPDRKATWGLTMAVIVYSVFFFVLVILLDAVFKYLFDFLVEG